MQKMMPPNATGGNTDISDASSNATGKDDRYADSGNGGNNGNRYGDSSEEVSEVAQALRHLFKVHPETRGLEPALLIDELYVWTNLGYEPPISVVSKALQVVT